LILNKREERGLETLRKLHRRVEDPEETLAREEFLQIRKQIELESSKPQNIITMLKDKTYRRRFLSGLFVQ
jgi:hypothetical protein